MKIKKFLSFLLAAVMLFSCVAYAASGTAKYFLTAEVSSSGQSAVNSVKGDMKTMGYSTTYTEFPTAAAVCSGIKASNLWVIHGHGTAGLIECKLLRGGSEIITSYPSSTSDKVISDFASSALSSTNYGLVIVCLSGATPSSGKSVVDEMYSKGAKTITGFVGSVDKGENWAEYLFVALKRGYTIADSFPIANAAFNQEFPNSADSPANASNRYTRGTTNKKLI